ncbi:hypothetical protein Y5W_01857 [Alcanivorax sp. 521-1]|uniref:Uncharacterized protein n=1 Tax=Alloalcanivorax profundimaris TaxID=2735259 RepID=A0ABS0AR00_9GAMM|nr:hypothetical protein [Alloalcanivorax profundimaris]
MAGAGQAIAAQPHQQALPGRVPALLHQTQIGGLHLRVTRQQTLERFHHGGGVVRGLAEQYVGVGFRPAGFRGLVAAVVQQ